MSTFIFVAFFAGLVVSFYLNNKVKIDKTKKKVEKPLRSLYE